MDAARIVWLELRHRSPRKARIELSADMLPKRHHRVTESVLARTSIVKVNHPSGPTLAL